MVSTFLRLFQSNSNVAPSTVIGPSDIPFSERFPKVKAITEEQIIATEDAFVASIKRCQEAGCMKIPGPYISEI